MHFGKINLLPFPEVLFPPLSPDPAFFFLLPPWLKVDFSQFLCSLSRIFKNIDFCENEVRTRRDATSSTSSAFCELKYPKRYPASRVFLSGKSFSIYNVVRKLWYFALPACLRPRYPNVISPFIHVIFTKIDTSEKIVLLKEGYKGKESANIIFQNTKMLCHLY